MSPSKRTRPATSAPARHRTTPRGGSRHDERMRWTRRLCGAVVAVVLAALLFEFTMVWTIGVGAYMVGMDELMGLWFLAGGYALACLPPAFGLLVATGSFWRSLTHALWIGLLYGTVGFLLLDQVAGLTL